MPKTILQKESLVLRETANPVPLREKVLPKTRKLLELMHKTLASSPDGVALAAPQIGVSLQIFVVSPKAFAEVKPGEPLVYINPVIVRRSRKKVLMEEGCLSVQNVFGLVTRHDKVTVEAYNEVGKKFRRDGSGLLAEIFQHETDHLKGVLFIDSARDLREVAPAVKKPNESK